MVHDSTPAPVLLVEDDAASARLVQIALRGSAVALSLSVVADGDQALAYLRRQGAYSTAPRPRLVFLDLNLPRKDGFAVLAEMKADSALRGIPVAVLTTSEAPADVQRSYDLGANCYIAKPHDLSALMTVLQATVDFWITIVTVPAQNA